MKINKTIFMKGVAIFVALFSVNAFSQESVLSQDKIIQIQDRVNSMPVMQLNDRKAQLLQEADDLERHDAGDGGQPRNLRSASEW